MAQPIYDMLSDLVAGVYSQLEADAAAAAIAGPPAVVDPLPSRQGVYNGGEVAADDCCAGQLYGRWVRTYPSTGFPSQLGGGQSCQVLWVADLRVGLLRCAPVPQGNAMAPTMDAIDRSARLLHRDQDAVIRAIAAWGESVSVDGTSWLCQGVVPLGPQGDCLGVEATVLVDLDLLCC